MTTDIEIGILTELDLLYFERHRERYRIRRAAPCECQQIALHDPTVALLPDLAWYAVIKIVPPGIWARYAALPAALVLHPISETMAASLFLHLEHPNVWTPDRALLREIGVA